MAHYTDAPPGYDNVVPPRVFAPLPNSGQRPFLGDDRSLFAPGTPEWIGSRTNLVQPKLPKHQANGLQQEKSKEQGWWKNFRVASRKKSRDQKANNLNWKPISLRAPFLLCVIIISIALIAVLQLLLIQSRRNGGIIFATDVNSLPLRTTFPYLYLPTIIAVVNGFLWNWVDLDVRRIEPFLQLAQEEGATGRDSLLLHYPVDFLASVPIKALKSRHWSVFTASIATVFVFWGLTPTQSGIFATDTLNRTVEKASLRSTSYLSLSEQANKLSAESAQSVVSIMWLNETLQPFMTRDYAFAPFGPGEGLSETLQVGNWTGLTLRYSVDVNCETPIPWELNGRSMINSTWGCRFPVPNPRVVADENNSTKVFDTLYVGYYNDDGLADYYLSDGSCPRSEPSSFLIQWSKTTDPQAFNGSFAPSAEEQRRHANVTTLYCRSSYQVQEVEATIRLANNEILGHQTIGDARPMASQVFNTSNFEAAMSMGHERFRVRTDFPTTDWPTQTAFLVNMPLNLAYLPTMAPFAIGATQLPLDEYLDPVKLANSYQSAYRLLFARQMIEVLSPILETASSSTGQWSYQTQSVILVPAFTYIVEALLVASILFASIIMYHSGTRVSKLQSDPATIAAIMSLAADDSALLNKLKLLDQGSDKELELSIRNRRFRLHSVQDNACPHRLQLLDLRGNEPVGVYNDELLSANRQQTMECLRKSNERQAGFVQGLQPTEFKAKMGLAFLATQIGLFVIIAALFVRIKSSNGLPLPSSNRFVRQLLENYLPTAVGTLIEPFWVVLNRHLCFLQPFDHLRQSRRTGKKTLSLEYSSLPPQLTIFKAMTNGDILLSVVCIMALLANGLSVALSGLFFENVVDLETSATFRSLFNPHFLPLDGAAGPFVTAHKQSLESVYIATSNRTAHTPLPPWTDSSLFYFPFDVASSEKNVTWKYRAETPAIGARLACQPLSPKSTFHVTGTRKDGQGQFSTFSIPATSNLTVSLVQAGRGEVMCIPRGESTNVTFGQPTGPSAYEFVFALDGAFDSSSVEASFCREHIAAGWVRSDLVNGTLPANESAHNYPVPSIISSHQETIIICKSTLMAGTADVLVNADGHIRRQYSKNISTSEVPKFLTTSPSDLIAQVHQIITTKVDGLHWHNDSLPSDFFNYLMEQATNSSGHLDPTKSPPAIESMIPPFTALYAQLFSTLISRNTDLLLEPAVNIPPLKGFSVQPVTRIFMSKPMFILAETILLSYIIVTIILYLRRPWKILCRMPTSIASIIAFVAASHAVKDFCGTVGMSAQRLKDHVQLLDDRYGFGTFIGTDGKTHVGIEKYPFLAPLTKEGDLSRQDVGDSKRGMRDEWKSRFTLWKSRKVREGGWM